jgi:adenosylcobinamide kinase/adenosylcobinamide-phosphate guanylyltransferase
MPGGPLLVECLGTWLTGLVDRAGLWDDLSAAAVLVQDEGEALVDALVRTSREVVLVTNEVGWSLVPLTPSGRFFTDALGRLNVAVAAVADHAVLVVLGRALSLGPQ